MEDVFRKNYGTLTDEQKQAMNEIKTLAEPLYEKITAAGGDQRCISIAKTNLEQAIMWAIKGVSAAS